jgi:hypothetical protein
MEVSNKLTLAQLQSIFYYDEASESGLRWKVDRWSGRGYTRLMAAKDSVAGTKREGYWKLRSLMVHRAVYMLANNVQLSQDVQIDHEDGNGFNNRKNNLRVADHSVQSRNKPKRADNKTGVTGTNIKRNGNRTYVATTWRVNGKVRNKYFSVDDLGYNRALELAKQERDRRIATLNSEGAGYTERHGR